MKTKIPMIGLLFFTFHATSRNLSVAYLLSLVVGAIFLVTGNPVLFLLFTFIVMLNVPMSIIMQMGSKDGKWERFQLTMPIRRGGLLGAQYLSILVAVVFSALLLLAVIGISVVIHEDMFKYGFTGALIEAAYSFGMPLLMTGLVFPLASSKIGQGREASVLSVCMLATMGISVFVPQASNWLGLSTNIITLALGAISVIVFIVSYFITRVLYAKIVF